MVVVVFWEATTLEPFSSGAANANAFAELKVIPATTKQAMIRLALSNADSFRAIAIILKAKHDRRSAGPILLEAMPCGSIRTQLSRIKNRFSERERRVRGALDSRNGVVGSREKMINSEKL